MFIRKLEAKRRGKLISLSDTLEKMMVEEKGFSDSYKRWNLYLNWKDVVGDMSRYSVPVGYYRGVLVISVDHAAYLQQLEFLKEDIKDMVNKFESNWVKSIKLQLRGE